MTVSIGTYMVHVEHTFRKMELTGKNPRTTLYSRITAKNGDLSVLLS